MKIKHALIGALVALQTRVMPFIGVIGLNTKAWADLEEKKAREAQAKTLGITIIVVDDLQRMADAAREATVSCRQLLESMATRFEFVPVVIERDYDAERLELAQEQRATFDYFARRPKQAYCRGRRLVNHRPTWRRGRWKSMDRQNRKG